MVRFQVVLQKGWYTWNLFNDYDMKVLAESKYWAEDKESIISSINFTKEGIFQAPILDSTPETPPNKRRPRGASRVGRWGRY